MTLIDKVLIQIQNDYLSGDLTALEELLKFVDEKRLESYLSEDVEWDKMEPLFPEA